MLDKLKIEGAYVNDKCNAVYLEIAKYTKNKEGVLVHNILGTIKITPNHFVSWFVDTNNCVSWEDHIKELKEREA